VNMITPEVPLIYTKRGNLPIDSLEYSTEWQFDDNSITFVEIHKAKDGEVVRRAVHVHVLKPLELTAETGGI